MLFVSKVDKIDCSTLSHLIFSLNNISLLSYRVVRAAYMKLLTPFEASFILKRSIHLSWLGRSANPGCSVMV